MSGLFELRGFLRPYRRRALLAPSLMFVEVGLDLLQPRLVQHVINHGVVPNDPAVVGGTLAWMLVLLALGLAAGIACATLAVRTAYSAGADLRAAVFRKIQSLSFADLDRLETGALVTRLTSDVNQIQEVVVMILRGMVRMPLLVVGSIALAALTSPRLGWVFAVLVPVLVAALVVIVRRSLPLHRAVQRGLDRLNNVLQENLAGVRLVKAFARAPHESKRFASANRALAGDTLAAVRAGAVTTPVMMFTLNAGIVAGLWLGGTHVQAGRMQVGEIVAFVNYLTHATYALVLFSNIILQVSRAQASAQRIGELLAGRPALVPAPGAHRRLSGRLAFENVSFGYGPPGADPVLRGISFTAGPGQTIGLLGATGSGKSTLVQLIPRFYDVTAGRVTLDGIDVRDLPEKTLRRHVSVALQEPVLFNDTLRRNIAMGAPAAAPDEVAHAAGLACAHDFINGLPEGYETRAGQRGAGLSGGQRQRVSIARALLPRPAILILDDSTSAVDLATEARLRDSLRTLDPAPLRIIVAQRISSVLHADKILVLDEGRLVAQGTHDELLETSPVYREIHASQAETVLPHGD